MEGFESKGIWTWQKYYRVQDVCEKMLKDLWLHENSRSLLAYWGNPARMALHFRKAGAENDRDIAPPKQRHFLAPCTAWCQCTRSTEISLGKMKHRFFIGSMEFHREFASKNNWQAENSMLPKLVGVSCLTTWPSWDQLMELSPPRQRRKRRSSSHGALPRLLGESGHAISGRSCLGCFGGVFLGLFPCWLWGFQAKNIWILLRAICFFSCWVFEG